VGFRRVFERGRPLRPGVRPWLPAHPAGGGGRRPRPARPAPQRPDAWRRHPMASCPSLRLPPEWRPHTHIGMTERREPRRSSASACVAGVAVTLPSPRRAAAPSAGCLAAARAHSAVGAKDPARREASGRRTPTLGPTGRGSGRPDLPHRKHERASGYGLPVGVAVWGWP
jgi:hypothetical protein